MLHTLSSRLLLMALLLSVYGWLYGQSALSGTVTSSDGVPVAYANALLLMNSDSTLVKGDVVADDGSFHIGDIPAGTYLLKVIMTGYSDYVSAPYAFTSLAETKQAGNIVLQDNAVLMDAVEVVAKKPLFEQRIDRMVVNVANSITSSGTNALEILERSPGVVVNHQNDLISLSGKNGVVVMINGRIQYMPAQAIVHMLEGMSSDNIERIEIINTPPAGFDAEGNAGYINIVLRKSLDDGLNGHLGGGIGLGHGNTGNANMNFNYRKGKYNLYGDYSFLHEAQDQQFNFYKRILLNDDTVETDTRSMRDPDRNDHNGRLGLDIQLDKNTILGGLISAYNTKWVMDALNTSMLTRNTIPDTNILIYNNELNQWKHLGGNLNFQHTFQEGRVLTFNSDYLWYKDNNPTEYRNIYSDGEGNPLFETYTRASKLTPISIFANQLDYTSGLGKKIKMESGAKVSFSHFTNDVGVEYLQGGTWVPDPELTARYDLNEEIYAAYGSLESPLGHGYTTKVGLRYEYTSSNLGSVEEADIVDRQFGEFFPSIFLTKDFNDKYALTASYSKRITRPTFNDMAPFVIFLDPYTFFSGNPALQPAIAHKFGLGAKLKTIVINAEYAIEDSTIARFQSSIIPGTNKELLFAENLKDTKTLSLTISIPLTPVKWWDMYYNFNASYQVARKYFEDQLSSFEAGGISFFSSQSFTLSKKTTLELSGYYSTGGLFGIVEVKSNGAVNIGVQQKFGNKGAALRVGYDDIFGTQRFTAVSDLPEQGQYYSANLIFQYPTFKISYSQPFGNQQMKGKRDRATGAEEERSRVTQ
jgi:outer membrane receptor protein involved in Fe transport